MNKCKNPNCSSNTRNGFYYCNQYCHLKHFSDNNKSLKLDEVKNNER